MCWFAVLAGIAMLLVPTPAMADEAADSLMSRVMELRQAGAYDQAAEVARQALELVRADREAKPYEITDAERLVRTLEFAVQLPDSLREQLARADRLGRQRDQCYREGAVERGIGLGREQLAIMREILGVEHQDVATSLNNLATLLQENGDHADAEPLYHESLAICRKVMGAEHPYVATSLNNLAALLQARGDTAGAELLFRQSLAIRRKALGPANLDVAQSLRNLAVLLQEKGDLESAEPLWRESVAIMRKTLGPEHADVATSLDNLATLLYARGDYAGAEPLHREALVIRRKVLGPEHPDVATSLNKLAMLLHARGDHADAETLLYESLAIRRKVLGPEHPDVATSLNNLAALLQAQGDYAGAEPLYRESLAIVREVLGPEHPSVATSLNNLASLLQARGDYAGAESLCRESLAIRRKVLGPEHPDVATSLNDLGGLLVDRGDYAGAEPLYRESLAIRRKALGPEHPGVAASLASLAGVLQDQGNYADAEPLYREALAIDRKVFGEEHPSVARSLNNLAQLLQDRGDYEQAEPLFRQALATCRGILGPEHPYVAAGLNNLAELLRAQGDYSGAEPLYRESLAIYHKVLGPEHPDVAASLCNLAELLRARGDYASAEPLYRESLAIFVRILGPEHPHVATSLINLGLLLQKKGDYAGAEPLCREALAIDRKVFGNEHPSVARSLSSLAWLLQARHDNAGAESLCRESLAIMQKALGPEHPDVATSLNNLATLLCARGDHAGSEALYREALTIQRKVLGPEHPDVALSVNNLAYLLQVRGDYADAEPFCREALTIRRKALGPEHPDVATSLNNLALLLAAVGDYPGAAAALEEAAAVFEAARLRVGSGLERATFQRSPYLSLAGVRLSIGDGQGAWSAAERDQGRVLADLLLRAAQRTLTPTEAAKEDSLRWELTGLEKQLEVLSEAAGRDSARENQDRLEQTRARLFETQKRWSTFERELAAKYPVTEGQAFALQRVQAVLRSNQAILGWLDVALAEEQYASWGYVIRNQGPVTWAGVESPEGSASGQPFSEIIRYMERMIDPRQLLKTEPLALWSTRIAPLAEALTGVEELIVIPSGAMASVPIEALQDSTGTWLGDRYRISYIPSATVYTWLQEKRGSEDREGPGKALLVGDPPFSAEQKSAMEREEMAGELLASRGAAVDSSWQWGILARSASVLGSLPRLPATREEIRGIASLTAEPTVWLGPEATEQGLARLARSGELAGYGTIHIATHAVADPEQPERSCLVLSRVELPDALAASLAGEPVYDGVVTAGEILQGWKLGAELVGLSACQTALGKTVGGEGTVGLAHAFLQAGAGSLLVSLWSVSDRSTALLMRRFYEDWWGQYEGERAGHRGGMTKAEALQEAKAWLRTQADETGYRYDHPYFWAPFILVGERK